MQSPSTPSPAASASTPPGVGFIIVLGSITFLGPLSIHLFFPVMPEVGRALSISPALVGLTFSVTLFVMAFITLVYGSLSDRLGRRPVLLTGLTLFTLGGVLSSFAGSVTGLIVGRVIQALGAGCSATLTRAIAHDAYGSEKLVKIIAYLTMAYTFGPMVAPLVGGVLIDAFGWRSAFWLSSVAGVAILFASWRMIHETHDAAHRRKQAGAAGSGSDGNSSAAHRLWRDYRSLLRQPRFLAFVLQTGFSTGTFLAMASGASFLMKDYLGRSATEFGLYFLFFPIGFFLGNLVSSRLSQRVSVETMVLAGSTLMLLGNAVQGWLMLDGMMVPLLLFIPGFVTTFAQGIAQPNAQAGAIRVDPKLTGTASGIGVFFQMFLGALCAQIYALLSDGSALPMVLTVTCAALLTFAAGVTPWLLRQRERATTSAASALH
jgi:DHA1 family bicyclomycin/chloramphenicol resistance-like MFS transporter